MAVKNGSVWLLTGKDEFLKKEFIRDLRAKFFPPASNPGLNYQEFSAEDHPLAAALDFIRTAPFLDARRLAVLHDIESLEDEEKTALPAALTTLPATAALVMAASETPKKDAFVRELSALAETVSCHFPFDNELPGWIQARARKRGLSVDRDAAALIAERTPKDAASLLAALESLALFAHPRTQIAVKDVEALLGKSLQADVFQLMDVIVDKNAAGALRVTASLLDEGTKAFEIVSVLAGQAERLRRAAALQRAGRASAEIGQELKVHPFFLDRLLRQAQKIAAARVKAMFGALLACDEAIKTGKLGDRLAVERLIIELCA